MMICVSMAIQKVLRKIGQIKKLYPVPDT